MERLLNQRTVDNWSWEDTVMRVIILILAIFVILTRIFAPCQIIGSSMLPNLVDGNTVILEKQFYTIERGDIVTARRGNKFIIKRVMGIEGDKFIFMESEDGQTVQLYRSTGGEFELLEEDYINGAMLPKKYEYAPICQYMPIEEVPPTSYVNVPKGYLYLMGDNRNDSLDSRTFGIFHISSVDGKMLCVLKKGSLIEKILRGIYHAD